MVPRAECPHCGRVGLGNIYTARLQGGDRPYRQCTYCSEIAWWDRDGRAASLERKVNRELANLHPAATEAEVEAVITALVPDTWEWVEATHVGGPRSIAFTRYGDLP